MSYPDWLRQSLQRLEATKNAQKRLGLGSRVGGGSQIQMEQIGEDGFVVDGEVLYVMQV